MYVATTMANSCAAANVSRTALPEIPLSPHQPGAGFKFPKRSFGKKTVVTRSFQASWFQQGPFLHYDEANDLAYCHTCVTGFKEKKMKSSKSDPAFVSWRMIQCQIYRPL